MIKKNTKAQPVITLIKLNSLLVSPLIVSPSRGIPTHCKVAILSVTWTPPSIKNCFVVASDITVIFKYIVYILGLHVYTRSSQVLDFKGHDTLKGFFWWPVKFNQTLVHYRGEKSTKKLRIQKCKIFWVSIYNNKGVLVVSLTRIAIKMNIFRTDLHIGIRLISLYSTYNTFSKTKSHVGVTPGPGTIVPLFPPCRLWPS